MSLDSSPNELKVIPTSEHLTFEGSMKEIEDYIKGAKNNETT